MAVVVTGTGISPDVRGLYVVMPRKWVQPGNSYGYDVYTNGSYYIYPLLIDSSPTYHISSTIGEATNAFRAAPTLEGTYNPLGSYSGWPDVAGETSGKSFMLLSPAENLDKFPMEFVATYTTVPGQKVKRCRFLVTMPDTNYNVVLDCAPTVPAIVTEKTTTGCTVMIEWTGYMGVTFTLYVFYPKDKIS